MEFIELARWEDALTDEIRERARTGSQGTLTKKYSVREDGAEVAYVALDWHELEDCTDLILYGMVVPEALRHEGIGSRILAEAERLAKGQRLLKSSFDSPSARKLPARTARGVVPETWVPAHDKPRLSRGDGKGCDLSLQGGHRELTLISSWLWARPSTAHVI
jgi:hypothetical protein